MSQPAARLTDLHTCPMQTPGVPPIPHVGGPIVGPGDPTTLIAGLPAARVGDSCVCVGPPDSIVKGSPTVHIGGRPAARVGDTTAHGGSIVLGCFRVLIGDQGSGGGTGSPLMALARQGSAQRAVLRSAAAEGSAFCELCERTRVAQDSEVSPGPGHRLTLVAAARQGMPFCEECARAAADVRELGFGDPAPAPQRDTLRRAAASGAPFCEECAAAPRH